MRNISIQINDYERHFMQKYRTSDIIDLIRDLSADEYDNCTEEDKKKWIVKYFKEYINAEIDLLFKDNSKVVISREDK